MAARSHWVKIDRTLDHIKALDDCIKAWLDSEAYTIQKQVKTEGPNTRTAYVARIPDPLPVAWSAYVGDAVHNLRSALDHVVYGLNAKGYAEANDGAFLPPGEARDSEFPIFGDEDRDGNYVPGRGATLFGGQVKKIGHVGDAAHEIIESLQPYQRGQDYWQDPLWLVHELDRIDKHRQLVVTAASVPKTEIVSIHFEQVIESSLGRAGPVKNEDVLSYWVVPAGMEPDDDLAFTRGVAFGEGTPAHGSPPVETLRGLRDYLRFNVAFKLSPLL